MILKLISIGTAFVFACSMICPVSFAETVTLDGGTVEVDVQDNVTNWNVTGNPVWNVPEFNVQGGATHNITGLGGNACLALLVNGGQASNIFGTMNLSNLMFILQNMAGINIGNTGAINLNNASLIASTLPLNLNATDFLKHDYQFGSGADGQAFLSNAGSIIGTDADLVALVSNAIKNSGKIEVPMGTVALAAGKTVTVGISPDGMVSIGVSEATANELGLKNQIENTGTITADCGKVSLTAKAVDGLFEKAINLTHEQNSVGIVRADDGTIEFQSMDDIYNDAILQAMRGQIQMESKNLTHLDGTVEAAELKSKSGTKIELQSGVQLKTQTAELDAPKVELVGEGSQTFRGDVTIHNLEVTTLGKELYFDPETKLTLLGHTEIVGDEGYAGFIKFFSSVKGSPWYIQLASPDYHIAYIGIRDSHNLGEELIQAKPKSDFGGNTGWMHNDTILTWAQLQAIGTDAASLAAAYELGENLSSASADYSGIGSNWTPIGTYVEGSPEYAFSGSFNGEHLGTAYTISDLIINKPNDDYIGLFGYTSSTATFANVQLLNVDITGKGYVGGLAGTNGNDYDFAGGTITNSSVSGVVKGNYYAGGLVGVNYGDITDSHSSATVTGIGINSEEIGGLVGYSVNVDYGADILRCYATGNVSGQYYIGGLVGVAYGGGTITQSYATGDVTGATYNVGGLVGENSDNILDSYATGRVSGTDSVGGLVGGHTFFSITNSYATGSVTGTTKVGGLVGSLGNAAGSVKNSFATGVATGSSNVGGLIGNNAGTITNSYWYNPVNNAGVGTNSGTGDATNAGYYSYFYDKDNSPLASWNFSGVWTEALSQSSNPVDYPYLSWEPTRTYIMSEAELVAIDTDSTTLDGHYYLGQSLTLSTSYTNAVIGDNGTPFTGSFNGNGYTLSNLSITENDGYTGLFGYTSGAALSDIQLLNASINGTSSSYIGGLVGYSDSSAITNVYVSGNVSGSDHVGVLAGYTTGSITNASTSGSATGYRSGGLAGSNYGTISNAFSRANVSSVGGGQGGGQGGLVGDNNGPVSNSYAQGNAVGSGTAVGGLLGYNTSTVTNSFATGVASGDSLSLGGLIGSNSGTITDSYWYNPVNNTGVGTNSGTGDATNAGSYSYFYDKTSDVYDTGATPWNFTGTWTAAVDSGSNPLYYPTLSFNPRVWTEITDNGSDLQNVANDLSGNYYLGADITSGISGFSSIGDNNNPFTGIFLGHGKTITGLTISESGSDYVGLFGYTSGATLDGIGLLNASITGDSYVGGLAGWNDSSSILNSYSSGVVAGTGTGFRIGGLVGLNNFGNITNCYSAGTVTTGGSYSGGLAGENYLGNITNSYSTATVSGNSNVIDDIGGLVGLNNWSSSIIINSYATGAVTVGNNSYDTGGLVGQNAGSIINSYSTGNVTGGSGSYRIGGFIGNNQSSTSNSFATGVASGSSNTGGLIGSNSGTVTNSYWYNPVNSAGFGSDSNSQSVSKAAGYSTFYDKDNSPLSSWDFTSVWTEAVDGTVYYPSLSFNPRVWTEITDNGSDLQNIANNLSGNYYLGADISSNLGSFSSLGDNSTPFMGILLGHGHTITGLTVSESGSDYVGLFGYTSGATITDIGLINVSITGTEYVGGLVGYNNSSTILDSYVSGIVASAAVLGSGVGGLVGRNNNGAITGSYSTANVSGNGSGYAGGLVGVNEAGNLTNVYATGAITGAGWDVGGLVGYIESGNITNAYATGNVTGTGSYIGGLVGSSYASNITNAYATGTVTGSNGSGIGGLVGQNVGAIINAFATGVTTGTSDVGGLIGNNSGTVSNSYWYNPVNSAGIGTDTNSQTVTKSNGYSDFYGTGQSVYTGSPAWDFTAVTGTWTAAVDSGSNPLYYPTLSFNPRVWTEITDDGASLQAISTDATTLAGNYYLGENITSNLSTSSIGDDNNPFTGIFLGHGKTITGLAISEGSDSYVGLFGYTNGATLDGIGLLNVTISGGSNVGGLVGYNKASTILNSYVTGTVTGSGFIVGGLVGQNAGSVLLGTYSSASVSGASTMGGLVGYNGNSGNGDSSRTLNSYATGNVNGGSTLGGLVGQQTGGNSITNSYSTGNVSGTGLVGGLVGFGNGGTITNSFATGVATSSGDTAGGLVGNNSDSITNSWWYNPVNAYGIGNTSDVGNKAAGYSYFYDKTSDVYDTTAPNWDFTSVWTEALDSGSNPLYYPSLTFNPRVWTEITDEAGLVAAGASGAALAGSYYLGDDLHLIGSYTGALIGDNSTADNNSRFTGLFFGQGHTISDLTITGTSDYAGLFGYTSGATLSGIGLLNVNVSGGNIVGGLVGFNYDNSSIVDSYAIGTVSGSQYVGGLIGEQYTSSVANSYANVVVSGSGNNVGGLVGYAFADSSITDSFAEGSVTGSNKVGGLVGYSDNRTIISDTYATGIVSGADSVGGLVGGFDTWYGDTTISNSYATGAVIGSSKVGGLVGSMERGTSFISNSFATGVASSTGDTAGGLIGNYVGGTLTNNWWYNGVNALGVGNGNLASVTKASGYSDFYGTGAASGGGAVYWDGGTIGGTPAWDFTAVTGTWTPAVDGSSNPLYYPSLTFNPRVWTPIADGELSNLGNDLAGNYYLSADITSGVSGFTSIGDNNNPFTGIFLGHGKTITGLTINSGSDYVGLFGYTTGATLDGVGLINSSVIGSAYSGSLVGYNDSSSIINCYATGVLTAEHNSGGLVGYNHSSVIMNAYFSGTFTANGGNGSGGLVGWNESSAIYNSYSTGNVTGDSSSYDIGGLVGVNDGASITNSYSSANVSGGGGVGGLVGLSVTNAGSSSVTNSFATGVATSSWDIAGGLIGHNYGTVSNSYWYNPVNSAGFGSDSNSQSVTKANGYSDFYDKDNSPLSSWDFTSVWTEALDGTLYYPSLSFNPRGWTEVTNSGATNLDDVASNLSGNYYLGEDITQNLSTSSIGDIDNRFTGIFLGHGKTITGLTISEGSDNFVGLFGYTRGATLDGIGLLGVTITGGSNTGGLVGYSDASSILNSYVTGSVFGGSGSYIGGLAGYNNGGNITNSYSTAAVSGCDRMGGLIGRSDSGAISNTFASGAVTGTGSTYNLGGLIGEFTGGSISNSYATGNVTAGSSGDYIGGLVGSGGGLITNAYATGRVTGSGSSQHVGGLAGENYSTITNSFATGVASGSGSNLGGLIGSNTGSVSNSYWYNDTNTDGIGNPADGYNIRADGYSDFYGTGTGDGATVYSTWDFTNVWVSLTNASSLLRATTDIWTGSGDWSNASNWSLGFAPNAASTVLFNDTGNSSSIDSSATDTLNNLYIDSGYSGTITQGRSLTVTGDYNQADGIFSAGAFDLTIYGNMRASGGTFDSDGNLYFFGDVDLTGGTFDMGTGTARFNAGTGITQTLNSGDNDFYQIIHGTPEGNNGTLQLTNDVTVLYTLTNNSGTFDANGYTPTVIDSLIVSGGTYLAKSVAQILGGLSISGGTFTGAGGEVDVNGDLWLNSGTFTAPSGNLYVSGNWSYNGGTFDANGGTVTFDSAASNGTQTLNSGGYGFFNVIHDGTNNSTLQLSGNGLTVTDSFNNNSGIFDGGGYAVSGTVNNSAAISGGTFGNLVRNLSSGSIDGGTFNGTLSMEGGTVSVLPTYGDSATLQYKGTGTQTTGLELPATIANLTVDNADGVILSDSLTVTGTLTMTEGSKFLVTVAADADQTKVYGESDPTLTYTITGGHLVNEDSLSGALGRAAGETVLGGPYAITQGSLAETGNYSITSFTSADFTITVKAASVTPDAGSKTYGDSDPLLTGSLAGFLEADGVSAQYDRVSGETVLGGPYTISATLDPAGVLSNYDITYNTAEFTIDAKSLTVTGITANNKSYDGNTDATLDTADAELVGVVGLDDVTLDVSGVVGAFASPAVGNDIEVTVSGLSLLGADESNYSLVQPLTTANITPVPLPPAPPLPVGDPVEYINRVLNELETEPSETHFDRVFSFFASNPQTQFDADFWQMIMNYVQELRPTLMANANLYGSVDNFRDA